MFQYFDSYAESLTGQEGRFYCEVHDGLIVRHVMFFDGVYYWATREESFDELYDFTERPEFGLPDATTVAMSADEFAKIWDIAIAQ